MDWIQETERGVLLHLVVIPNSTKTRIGGFDPWRGAIKVYVAAPPAQGSANSCLIDFLAELLGVEKSKIEIVSGHHSREKVLAISGLSKKLLEERINAGNKEA
ncbi:MAG: DUF167 domain-containing protein [Thermoplasmata archaeon]